MTNAEKVCREYWSTCVKTRDKWCIITGEPNIQAHHLFLRSQGNWVVQFDIDYGVSLRSDLHDEMTAEPYGKLFDKVINRIRQGHDEILFGDTQNFGRADKILTYKNSVKKPCTIDPDFKLLKRMLSNLLRNLRDQAWTDSDCEGIRR